MLVQRDPDPRGRVARAATGIWSEGISAIKPQLRWAHYGRVDRMALRMQAAVSKAAMIRVPKQATHGDGEAPRR